MLECNRFVKRKLTKLARAAYLIVPLLCIVLLLSQTVFAKSTYLINDGGRVVIHSTYATDPAAILSEAGLVLGEDDTYTTETGDGMAEITVQRKQLISVVYGSKTTTVVSYGETVESLLSRLHLQLDQDVILSEPLDAMTYDGMVLTVSKSVVAEQTYTETIPFETQYCYDPSLPEGQEVVLTAGVDGQLLCTVNVEYVNGKEVSRKVLSQDLIRQPVNAVIAIGTYTDQKDQTDMPVAPPVTQPPAVKPDSTKPTPSLPEKPGLPTIADGVIITPDGEALTYTNSMQMVATAYNNADPGCTIWTATGTLCRVGAIAVDPSVIPYGTRMYIVTNDGRYVYGIAVAEDCGGSIKGNRVDLYFDTVQECINFGIRDCTVYFLG